MSRHKFRCFLWNNPELSYKESVLSGISNICAGTVEIACCSSAYNSKGIDDFPSVQAILLDHCRRHDLLPNQRATYYSPRDHFLALRLVMDSVERTKPAEECITESDFTFCERQYVKSVSGKLLEGSSHAVTVNSYRDFLEKSNAVNDWTLQAILSKSVLEENKDCLLNSHLLVMGNPTRLQEMVLLKLLIGQNKVYSVTTETALDASFTQISGTTVPDRVDIQLLDSLSLEEYLTVEPPPKHSGSAGQRYAEDVYLAFLRLVVNLRDELALVKALMSPLVSLPQQAFLSLKRKAAGGQLSICQTALSYITKVELGGQSYAPPIDCPLRAYLPQLKAFGQVMDKLQTITEEEKSSVSAMKRLISWLTNRFLKTAAVAIRPESVQVAAARLLSIVSSLEAEKDRSQNPASQGSNSATINFLQRVLDRCASWHQAPPLFSGLGNSNTRTPIAAISPFTFFRTPKEEEPDPFPSLSQRIGSKKDSLTPVCRKKFKAGLPWGVDELMAVETRNTFPSSPFQVQEVVEKQNLPVSSDSSRPPEQNVKKQSGVKRSIFGEITNQKSPKNPRAKKISSEKRGKLYSIQKSKEKIMPQESKLDTPVDLDNNQIVEPAEKKMRCKDLIKHPKRKRQEIVKNQPSISTFFKKL